MRNPLNGNAKSVGVGSFIAVGTFLVLMITTHFTYRDRVERQGAAGGVTSERLSVLRLEFNAQREKTDQFMLDTVRWQAAMDYKIGLLLKERGIDVQEGAREDRDVDEGWRDLIRNLRRAGDRQ